MLTTTRSIALGAAVSMSSLLGAAPPAEGLGAAACTISGTINFAPSPDTPTSGTWSIDPAVIDCRGLFNYTGWERMLGTASFTGAGTYTTASGGRGACLHHVGSGTVDYMIRTSAQDIHVIEPHTFVLAGAGTFDTPTLRGAFQITPTYEGGDHCLSASLTKAFFLAEGLMVRSRTPGQGATDGESTEFHDRGISTEGEDR